MYLYQISKGSKNRGALFSPNGSGVRYYLDDEDWNNLVQHSPKSKGYHFRHVCVDVNNPTQGYLFICDHRYFDFKKQNSEIELDEKYNRPFSFVSHETIESLEYFMRSLGYINDNGIVLKEIPGLPVKIGSEIEIGYHACHQPRFCIRECPIDGFDREMLLEYLDKSEYSELSREELWQKVVEEFEECEDYDDLRYYVNEMICRYSTDEEICPVYDCQPELCFVKNTTKAAE